MNDILSTQTAAPSALMLDQMAAFDRRNARCTVESDRDLVEHQVRRLFYVASGREEDEGTAAPNTEGLTPLDAFSEYVRGPLRSAVLESVVRSCKCRIVFA